MHDRFLRVRLLIAVLAPIHNLNVTKEVILSAGAANSPQILLLSGIGPKADLASLNIPAVVDNEAVGKNMQVRPFDVFYLATISRWACRTML